jgi:hypothetical protein
MKKIFFMLCFIFSLYTLYAQNINDLYLDLEHSFRLGYRPISQGVDRYLYARGVLITTFSQTDFSIAGEGFFVLLDEENNRLLLTRNGAFHYNNDILVNHENLKVLSSKSNNKIKQYVFLTKNDKIDSNSFLIGMPIMNEFIIINREYIEPENILIHENNIIVRNTLENMPISLQEIIDDILYYFRRTDISLEIKKNDYNILKEKCYILFRNNFLVIGQLKEIFKMLNDIEYLLIP